MPAPSHENPGLWVNANAVAVALGVDRRVVPGLARAGRVGTRKLPGVKVRYYLPDVERLAFESITTARKEPAPCPVHPSQT